MKIKLNRDLRWNHTIPPVTAEKDSVHFAKLHAKGRCFEIDIDGFWLCVGEKDAAIFYALPEPEVPEPSVTEPIYRLLNIGEVTQKGDDKWDSTHKNWKPEKPGLTYENDWAILRRKIADESADLRSQIAALEAKNSIQQSVLDSWDEVEKYIQHNTTGFATEKYPDVVLKLLKEYDTWKATLDGWEEITTFIRDSRHAVAGEKYTDIIMRLLKADAWAKSEDAKLGFFPESHEVNWKYRAENWMNTAVQNQRNADFYRGIVEKIGNILGVEARTADDGTVGDSVHALKVPELVAKLLPPVQTYRILDTGEKTRIGDQYRNGSWVTVAFFPGSVLNSGHLTHRRLWDASEKYRMLEEGEKIREGDEYKRDDEWHPHESPTEGIVGWEYDKKNVCETRRKVILDTTPPA